VTPPEAGGPKPEALEFERAALVRTAFELEWLTLAWMVVEAAVAIGAGLAARSLLLLAFGVDSIIELASAGLLLWRLSVELRHGRALSEAAERAAGRIGGILLFALAVYVVAGAAYSLWQRQGAEFSAAGLALTVAAIPIMYFLARRKLRIADEIGSRALRADAVESVTCGWLSLVVVAGLGAQLAFGAWWIDAVASLAIVYFLVKEGREAWAGDACGDRRSARTLDSAQACCPMAGPRRRPAPTFLGAVLMPVTTAADDTDRREPARTHLTSR
jgi:divalent metal cation (Fe/Co/Zn/Cd) transporter